MQWKHAEATKAFNEKVETIFIKKWYTILKPDNQSRLLSIFWVR
jgi:hypothetical protein